MPQNLIAFTDAWVDEHTVDQLRAKSQRLTSADSTSTGRYLPTRSCTLGTAARSGDI